MAAMYRGDGGLKGTVNAMAEAEADYAPAQEIRGDIPTDLKIKNGQRFLFISRDQRLYTHSIHKYPAKFFPELPRWIIDRYSREGDLILDPFMGSGTANLEAMLSGRPSVGVDIDPFSRFLAKAKTTLLDPNALLSAKSQLEEWLDRFERPKARRSKFMADIPVFPYRDNWFKPSILKELAYIKHGIEELRTPKNIRSFLLICFSSILRQTSQADNNCTRTVIRKRLNKQVEEGYPMRLFKKKLRSNVEGMLALIRSSPVRSNPGLSQVSIPDNASATDLGQYRDETFELALTSPPYVNAVDYPRTHQLEMYWLGLANGSLRDLKRDHIGTEVVTAEEYSLLHKTGVGSADRIIRSIYQVDKRRAFIASKYTSDMIANMREVYRVLRKNGRYVIVVGSNFMRGYIFETWRYLKDAAPSIGYEVEGRFVSGIINHFIKVPRKERINEDHILILRK